MLRKAVREKFVRNGEFAASTVSVDGSNVSGIANFIYFCSFNVPQIQNILEKVNIPRISMEFCTDIDGPQRMKSIAFGNLHVAPPWGWHVWFWVKYVDHFWMDSHKNFLEKNAFNETAVCTALDGYLITQINRVGRMGGQQLKKLSMNWGHQLNTDAP